MFHRPFLPSLGEKVDRFKRKARSSREAFRRKVRTAYDEVTIWSDTPAGRLAQWVIGIVLTLIAIKVGATR